MIKRMLTLLLTVCFLAAVPSGEALAKVPWPDDTGVLSEAGIVVDYDSGAVLYGQNIHDQKAPASITKLLTALVVAENADLEDKVEFSHAAVYDVEGGSGNKHNMEEGDVLSVEECLYLLLLRSSNQAANALAEHVAGSIPAFAEMMNDKCEELGLTDSHFANPSGLNDDSQKTTAYDMAVIARAAFENPVVYEIDTTTRHHLPETINNPNGATLNAEHKLLITEDPESEFYYPYALAGKTGYTSVAGQTLVTLAEYGNRKLIAVTMKSTDKTHYSDTIALLNFGFNEFKNENIAKHEKSFSQGDTIIDLGNGAYKASDLTVDPDAVVTLPENGYITDAERTVETDLPANAPGGAVARICYRWDDRLIGSAYVISKTGLAALNAPAEPETPPAETEPEKPYNPVDEWTSSFFGPIGEGVSSFFGAIGSFFSGIGSAVSGLAAGAALAVSGFLAAHGRTLGIVLCAAAAVLIPAFLILRKIKKDKAVEQARHERRKQRLEEMGLSEEVLQKRLEEKRGEWKQRAEELKTEALLADSGEKPGAVPAAETAPEESQPEESPAEESPMEENSMEESPAEESPAEETAAEKTSGEEAPVGDMPAAETPRVEAAAAAGPAAEEASAEAPFEETPAEVPSAEVIPAKEASSAESPEDPNP